MLALHPYVCHSLAGPSVHGCCVPTLSLSSHRPSTSHGSDYILRLPHWDSSHPTLMLYADKRFNNAIEDGRVWFLPAPNRPDEYLVCCAESEDNDFLRQHCTLVGADGVPVHGAALHELRRPDDSLPARALWPPPLVFDLHREVWLRYRRNGNACQPAKKYDKKQRTEKQRVRGERRKH